MEQGEIRFDDPSESLKKKIIWKTDTGVCNALVRDPYQMITVANAFYFCNVNFILIIQGVVGATKPISPVYYFWRLFFGIINTPCKIVFINARYRRSLASMMCAKYRSGLKDLTDTLLDIRVTSHERWNVCFHRLFVQKRRSMYFLQNAILMQNKSMLWRHQSEYNGLMRYSQTR